MTAEPLKPSPCPWCQSSDIDIVHVDIRQKNGQMVCNRCCNCGASGPIETVENPNHEEVVATFAWNTRKKEPDKTYEWLKNIIENRIGHLQKWVDKTDYDDNKFAWNCAIEELQDILEQYRESIGNPDELPG